MSGELPNLPTEILESEVKDICERYRINPDDARTIVERSFARRPDVVRKILETHSEADITRLRGYRETVKTARKQVYYELRQYRRNKEELKRLTRHLEKLIRKSADGKRIKTHINELLRAHLSTRERLEYYDSFYLELFKLIESPRTILDVGCGLNPLSYPFGDPKHRPEVYVALDKDPDVIETLTIFAPFVVPTRLVPVCLNLAQATWSDVARCGIEMFDIACMLKLIPVLHRQSKELIPMLLDVPARQVLMTGSSQSMTRREDIAKREDSILKQYVKGTARPVIGSLKIENEFGYVLGPPPAGGKRVNL